ncbi:MAG: dihydrolipoamide acetyltransferase family protein [archaeon]
MALDFRFPDVGEGIHEGELVKWLVKEGDEVKADQAFAEVETDKAVVEIPSPKAGIILKLHVENGQRISVGQVIATIGEKGETYSGQAPAQEAKIGPKHETRETGNAQENSAAIGVLATPATRKAAREMGIDIEKVRGTGSGGRITEEDLKAFTGKGQGNEKTISSPEKTDFEKEGEIERIPLRGTRKVIAERMAKSFRTIPHAVHMDEVDVTELVKLKEREKGEAAKRGARLTYLPFIIKATVFALKNNPRVNASLDEAANEIVVKKYYHIGVAVDTDDGLVVVTVRNADKKSIIEIAQEVEELAGKAKTKKIALEDLRGSTFTITNIGAIGGTWSFPIINYPNAAILGVHRIKERPIAVEGKVRVRSVLNLSLSFDHRIIDGADAARFMNDIMVHLEDPAMMLVDSI